MAWQPLDVEAQQDGLLAEVGTFDPTWEYVLFDDDPAEGGMELASGGGYVAQSAAGVSWAVEVGEPAVTADVDFTHSGGGWSGVAQWWGLRRPDASVPFAEPLSELVDVNDETPAGTVTVSLVLGYRFDY